MQNPPKRTIAACLPSSESFLIIFMGVLRSPHRRCAFRIVSTLVYSQCHVVPLYPLRGRRERGNWAREPCYVVWRVGFGFDGSHAVASSTPARIPAFPAGALRASRLSVCDGKEAVPGARPAIVCERESPGTPPDGPGSGSALRPAACTPSRSQQPPTALTGPPPGNRRHTPC